MNEPPDMIAEFRSDQPVSSSHDELTALRTRIAELERETADLKWTNRAINALAACAGSAQGRSFLRALVQQLSDILKVSHVFITELSPGGTDRVRVVAGWSLGRTSDPLEYDLASTPCKIVMDQGSAFFPEGAWRLFAQDAYLTWHRIESYMGESLFGRDGRKMGHLCIMDEHPFLFDHAQGRAIVRVFAERAGAELERLRADEIIRQREERFRTLYDDNPSMYFTLSPEGLIVSVNRYGAAQLGYTVDELVGQSVLTVFDATDRETVLAQLRQCADHPFRAFTWEIQKIRKDGSRLWVHERARAIVGSDSGLMILVVCEDVTEHRRTGRLLATLIHESPLPIISLDHAAKVTSWNPAAVKLFGWSEEEVIGKELPYIPPGEEDAADCLWEAGVRGELTAPVELRRRRKDGTLIDLLLWPVYIREGPGGEFETAIGILVDQSNLIRAEAARRESERRLRMIIDSEPECVKTVDVDGSITSMNPAGLAILGATAERDILGKPVFSFIHPQDRPAYERFHRMVCAGETGILTFRIIDVHGNERYLEAHSVPLRNDDGIVTGALSIARDVTVRKQAEEALRASEASLHQFVADAPVGLAILDHKKRMVRVNKAFCRLTGYDESELLGQTYALFTHPEDLPQNVLLTDGLLGGGCIHYNIEKRYIRKSGEVIWVSVEATTTALPGHSGPLVLAAAHDITARKHSESLLAGEMRCLELISQETPLSTVLETLCTMIERQNPELLCSILLLNPHTARLHPAAAPSLPSAYLRSIDGIAIGPSVGSCGTAAFSAKTITVSDIAEDPRWTDCRAVALDHGLRACWSMPILSPSKQVLGTFAIYSRRVARPTSVDLSLMERATHLAGIAIVREQTRNEREQLSRDLHDNILQSLYAIGMQMEAAKLAREQAPRTWKTHVARAIEQLNHLVLDIRHFIGLLTSRTTAPSDFGDALRQLAASMCVADQSPPAIEIAEVAVAPLTPFQKQQLLNIAREALSNSVRHAQAAHRWVRLSRSANAVLLEIGDDGIGFAAGRPLRRGHGLANMAARAKKLEARFSLESAPGKGTRLTVETPIEKGPIHEKIRHDPSGDRRRPRGRAHRTARGA
jgi:PAS domain S-box-containing protein